MTLASSMPLLLTAATVAAVHTLLGVDHALPFVALARAGRWTLRRTLLVTLACGIAHVASSILLGIGGIALGAGGEALGLIETTRGAVAAYVLMAFGLAYAARAAWRQARAQRHSHVHAHADGTSHHHNHDHVHATHLHPHADGAHRATTVWALFIIFALGPCEPLIPLMMAPAAMHDAAMVALVAGSFGAVTVAMMLGLVTLGHLGVARLEHTPWLARLERHAEILAGLAVFASGAIIQALGV